MGFSSVPAGPLISDSFLVWRSYSSVETNFSQDILAQADLMELIHVLRKMHTSSMSWGMVEMPTCHEIDDTHW